MADHSPLPLIRQEDIELRRTVEGGKVVTRYYDKSGQEILRPVYHLQGADAGFVPPPS